MQTYARQGGTSSIFVNDDGLRLLPPAEAAARLSFYATHNIGWVARPAHTYNAKTNPQGMYLHRGVANVCKVICRVQTCGSFQEGIEHELCP